MRVHFTIFKGLPVSKIALCAQGNAATTQDWKHVDCKRCLKLKKIVEANRKDACVKSIAREGGKDR